jgi:serine/threonine protein kinase
VVSVPVPERYPSLTELGQANVLISDDFRPLITDFGCSKILKMNGFTTDLKASLKYMAPELMDVFGVDDVDVNGKKKSGTPSTKETDVWAFGLVGAEVRSLYHANPSPCS